MTPFSQYNGFAIVTGVTFCWRSGGREASGNGGGIPDARMREPPGLPECGLDDWLRILKKDADTGSGREIVQEPIPAAAAIRRDHLLRESRQIVAKLQPQQDAFS